MDNKIEYGFLEKGVRIFFCLWLMKLGFSNLILDFRKLIPCFTKLKLDFVEWKLKLREKNLVYKYLQISVLPPPYIKLRKYFAILMENLKFALL